MKIQNFNTRKVQNCTGIKHLGWDIFALTKVYLKKNLNLTQIWLSPPHIIIHIGFCALTFFRPHKGSFVWMILGNLGQSRIFEPNCVVNSITSCGISGGTKFFRCDGHQNDIVRETASWHEWFRFYAGEHYTKNYMNKHEHETQRLVRIYPAGIQSEYGIHNWLISFIRIKRIV